MSSLFVLSSCPLFFLITHSDHIFITHTHSQLDVDECKLARMGFKYTKYLEKSSICVVFIVRSSYDILLCLLIKCFLLDSPRHCAFYIDTPYRRLYTERII